MAELFNAVTEEEYELGKAGRLALEALEEAATEGNPVTRRLKAAPDVGYFALDKTVLVTRVYDRGGHFKVAIAPIGDDGETSTADVEVPKVSIDGVIIPRNPDSTDPEEGYFLAGEDQWDELLRRQEEEMLIPVRVRRDNIEPPHYREAA